MFLVVWSWVENLPNRGWKYFWKSFQKNHHRFHNFLENCNFFLITRISFKIERNDTSKLVSLLHVPAHQLTMADSGLMMFFRPISCIIYFNLTLKCLKNTLKLIFFDITQHSCSVSPASQTLSTPLTCLFFRERAARSSSSVTRWLISSWLITVQSYFRGLSTAQIFGIVCSGFRSVFFWIRIQALTL